MTRNVVYINDVGPRDGLQNQTNTLSVKQRISLINALVQANVAGIEVGSFVSPIAVPAMAHTDEVISGIHLPTGSPVQLSALIPNMRGYESGRLSGIGLLSLVMAASNTMNEKNIRMDNQATLDMFRHVMSRALADKQSVQIYLATAWECPFEGHIQADKVVRLAEQLFALGASRLVIADTIGAASPDQVEMLLSRLLNVAPADTFSCHFHDTRAMGLANVYAALKQGIRRFDASIAGMGGCPFAPGASGNVATEDVVMLCEQMGFSTGVDMPALLDAANLAIQLTQGTTGGNAKPWLEKQLKG